MINEDVRKMVVLFGEIHSHIESHPMVHSLTQDHLDEEFLRKVSEQKHVTFDDSTKYCDCLLYTSDAADE